MYIQFKPFKPSNLALVPLEHVHQKHKLAVEGRVDPQVHERVAREVVKRARREALGDVEGVLGAAHAEGARQAQRADEGEGQAGEDIYRRLF